MTSRRLAASLAPGVVGYARLMDSPKRAGT